MCTGMMKNLFAIPLVVLLASCVSIDLPGPGDHLIVYGSLRTDSPVLDQQIERIVMVRVEPDSPRFITEPFIVDGMFFTAPLPLEGHWKGASVTVAGEEVPVSGVDFAAMRPGLLFLGSLEIASEPSPGVEARRLETPDERKHLQTLLDAWNRTPWEELIRARIRALDRDRQS